MSPLADVIFLFTSDSKKSASYSDSIKVKDTGSCKNSLSFLRAERTDGEFPGPAVCVKFHRRCSSDALKKKSSTKLPPTVRLASAAARKLKPTFLFPFTNLSLFRVHQVLIARFLGGAGGARPQTKAINRHKPGQHKALDANKSSGQTSMGGGAKHDANQKATLRFFISPHQSPTNGGFLGPRRAAGRVGIGAASVIRRQTDDRTLESLLRRFWTITHSRRGFLAASL